MGNRFYGFSSIFAAVRHPEVFGKAAMQSVVLGLGAEDELESLIGSGSGREGSYYLDWNRFDERNIDRGWDVRRDSKALNAMLQSAGYEVGGGEVLDSYGWGGWRNRADRVLVALFPMEE
jgi:enterochelin esterase-like enzyme